MRVLPAWLCCRLVSQEGQGLPGAAAALAGSRAPSHAPVPPRSLAPSHPSAPTPPTHLSSLIESTEDLSWEAGQIESESSVVVRGFEFLNWLMQRPETNIAVVTHSAFLWFTLACFGNVRAAGGGWRMRQEARVAGELGAGLHAAAAPPATAGVCQACAGEPAAVVRGAWGRAAALLLAGRHRQDTHPACRPAFTPACLPFERVPSPLRPPNNHNTPELRDAHGGAQRRRRRGRARQNLVPWWRGTGRAALSMPARDGLVCLHSRPGRHPLG